MGGRAYLLGMAASNSIKAMVPHTGRGRWVAGLVAALLFLVAIVWVMTSAFQGRHIRRNAEALTAPVTEPAPAVPAGNRP